MAENVKLKDLYADEKVYDGINTVKIPKADGTGNAKFIIPPSQKFMLRESDYQEDYVQGSSTTIAVSEDDESGGFVLVNIANAMMHMSEPKIISVAAFVENNGFHAYHSMVEQTITEFMTRIFQSEAEDSVVVTPDTYTVKKGWTNIVSTVTTEGNIVRVAIEKFEQIADPSAFTFDASLPWHINEGKENYFYSYIAEATQQVKSVSVTENGTKIINPDSGKSGLSAVQLSVDVPTGTANLQDKSVAITENGTQEFSPDTGYDGIKKLTATVNVAGGGGPSVQPDYAQNNTTAVDYIKNRPGGYMVETPSISKTMTAADYRSDNPDSDGEYKFSDIALPDESILNATGKVKIVANDGTETEHDIDSIVFAGSELIVREYTVSIVGSADTLEIISGVMPVFGYDGTYIRAKRETTNDVTTVVAYISQLTTAAYSTTVEIPEKFTEVKTANWGSGPDEPGYIPGRPGGYFLSFADFAAMFYDGFVYTWDGVVGGKEVVEAFIYGTAVQWVKISDTTPPPLLYVNGSAETTTVTSEKTSTSEATFARDSIVVDIGGLALFTIGGNDEIAFPIVCISYGNPGYFMEQDIMLSQGVWFLHESNGSSGGATYVSKFAPPNNIDDTPTRMPYELVEQNPNTLTTDAQTLTDAQKLQARTNIGTVAGTDKEMILSSSTAGSTKRFKITVTDDGTLTATEVTQ